jgi:hypothetical protein
MSEEGGDDNTFLIFVSLGIANLGLGALFLSFNINGIPQLSSWGFVVAGLGFLIAAFGARYEDSGGFLDSG